MKVLTIEQMREVDRLTAEAGIAGVILMENAGSRVVEFLQATFSPLHSERVLVVCGKGNNGGDGFAVARQLWTRKLCRELFVWELFPQASLSGDAAAHREMLGACGCPVSRQPPDASMMPTVVVDAILGTGLSGSPRGEAAEAIEMLNERFASAHTVAVDIPSGLPGMPYVKAAHTVTFTAPKTSQVFGPSYALMGRLHVVPIGSPPRLYETNTELKLNLTTPDDIRSLFAGRPCDSNKGMFGHVLVVGGSYGKSGAPVMAGMGAYRSGAGLVTVAIPPDTLPMVASYRPELMTEPTHDCDRLLHLLQKMTVLALGPGLGTSEESVNLARRLYETAPTPAVVDADALNALAGQLPRTDKVRILTPHPGEMGRLTGLSVKDVQADRLPVARQLSADSGATVVLKGDRTIIAFADGESWINPTGSPSMATGGTGDILTGMIAGLVAQHPKEWRAAVIAAVWLHGRTGELGAVHWGEEAMLATDMLPFLPEAIRELRPVV